MSEGFIGEIRMFGGTYAPMDWAFCDGSTLQISQYDALYSLIGTTYGGDGTTNFKLPDLRGRLPIHMGQGPDLTSRVLGQSFGTETVTLDSTNISAHNHQISVGAPATTAAPAGNYLGNSVGLSLYSAANADSLMNPAAVGMSAGSPAQPHANVMPCQCVNFIIALYGIFPQRQ